MHRNGERLNGPKSGNSDRSQGIGGGEGTRFSDGGDGEQRKGTARFLGDGR